MNLSPDWTAFLAAHGVQAQHWSAVGAPNAPDTAIMAWAREHDAVVLTHDLDFGTLLALTHAAGPSVLQVRAADVSPGHLGPLVVAALTQLAELLTAGALVTVDEHRMRARVLPIGSGGR